MTSFAELGVGLITKAGATYVPQLARTLQTEQVIPPGAAPNGVMDTEASAPPELPWANQSGSEGAANTVAEQRALEKAAECAAAPWTCITRGEDPLLKFELNISNTAALYDLTYLACANDESEALTELDAVLVTLGGAEGSEGILAQPNVVLNEFGAVRVGKWLEKLEDGLYNCIDEMVSTFAGGNKGCRVEFFSIALHGTEFEGVEEPEFSILPAVSFCQYGECYLQNSGLGENPLLGTGEY